MSEAFLALAGFEEDAIADGPGLRAVVFVQGCPHHCPGCHNPQTWSFEGGTRVAVETVAQRIMRNPLTTGVTFSGGEPFAQAEALAALAERLGGRYELAVYTGYTFEALQALAAENEGVARLLKAADILVDGPFKIAEKDRTILWRGSRNQRLLDAKASLAAGKPVWTQDPDWIGEAAAAAS
jgi:anaerobic ribonucleoside-triphosphate reductase activating protein